MTRAIFLDVDGTYADRGIVPDVHVDAVRRARAAGNAVLLCTGRPLSMLPERITSAGFDGVVATSGAYVQVGDQVLADRRIEPDVGARLVRMLDDHRATYVLEAPHALYGTPATREELLRLRRMHAQSPVHSDSEAPEDIIDILRVGEDLTTVSFAKVAVVHADVPMSLLAELAGEEIEALGSSIPGLGPGSGELYRRGVHKAVGMELAATHLGVAAAQVYAFGDGLNDLEMLMAAGVGVAIEGSDPRVLAAADAVAARPSAGGLATAFEDLGLI